MSRQMSQPFHFPAAYSYSSQSKHEATSACNTAPRISFFPSCYVTSNPLFSFQWPQAPIADASMRLPPLVAQATQALQDVRNPTHFSWPTAAEARAKLPPPATQAHTSQTFPPVTNTPFFFSMASSSHSRPKFFDMLSEAIC